MIDRGIIKWQPFDSCYSSSKIIKDINNSKNKIVYPTLSEDQLEFIEEKIECAYHLSEIIDLDYFYNGKIINIKGKINYIDMQHKNIYINNKSIYFKQIVNIN